MRDGLFNGDWYHAQIEDSYGLCIDEATRLAALTPNKMYTTPDGGVQMVLDFTVEDEK
ncbi:MAG: hypothetical protein WB780_24475 [Candidatus Acidiferrales bacterium]